MNRSDERTRRRGLRLGACLALASALLGVALCGGCAPLTSRLVLFASRDELAIGNAERVMVADPAGSIETIRARSPGAARQALSAIVLRFYGNADRADQHAAGDAELFGDWPVEVWGVNYPGFGRSEGTASLTGVARAADVALAEAEKRGLPVYSMGTSMGTTAALHLSARGRIRGLLLENPPPLAQLIRGRYGWWNLWLLAGPISWGVPSSLDSLGNARAATVPLLMLSSELDEVVPFSYQTELFDAYQGRKERIVMTGARHNSAWSPQLREQVRTALQQQGWR
jgi:pimeloyl-ACP methyl ester carboxylesterase